jgi:hypothetical protein
MQLFLVSVFFLLFCTRRVGRFFGKNLSTSLVLLGFLGNF